MKRKSNRAYYFPKPESSALERVLGRISVFGPPSLAPELPKNPLSGGQSAGGCAPLRREAAVRSCESSSDASTSSAQSALNAA